MEIPLTPILLAIELAFLFLLATRFARWRESQSHAGLRWEFMDYSPHNPQPSTVTDAGSTSVEQAKHYICPLCEGVESNEPGDCPKCSAPLCGDHVAT